MKMTLTLSSRNRVRRLCEDAAFLCAALMLSYVEALFPLSLIVPLPGAKIGLANLAVMLACHRRSFADAAAVSVSRVLLSAILFGSVSSLAFSLSGAICSLAVLAIAYRLYPRALSFIGVSVLCAAAHNIGQIVCAVFWLSSAAVFSYLPLLLLFAVLFGTLSGALANLIAARILKTGKERVS